jgi:RNA polymerase sigma-70 factor (ECF subfamily)
VFDEMKDNRFDQRFDPEALMIQRQAAHTVRRAIEELPVDLREVIVLRELEGMSCKDIAAVVGIPMGTVMSRLGRGRERLLVVLALPSTLEGYRDVS